MVVISRGGGTVLPAVKCAERFPRMRRVAWVTPVRADDGQAGLLASERARVHGTRALVAHGPFWLTGSACRSSTPGSGVPLVHAPRRPPGPCNASTLSRAAFFLPRSSVATPSAA